MTQLTAAYLWRPRAGFSNHVCGWLVRPWGLWSCVGTDTHRGPQTLGELCVEGLAFSAPALGVREASVTWFLSL